MCGIIGIALGKKSTAATEILEGLVQLQHRGQDACGIAVARAKDSGHSIKGKGLLSDVFGSGIAENALSGNLGLGHGE